MADTGLVPFVSVAWCIARRARLFGEASHEAQQSMALCWAGDELSSAYLLLCCAVLLRQQAHGGHRQLSIGSHTQLWHNTISSADCHWVCQCYMQLYFAIACRCCCLMSHIANVVLSGHTVSWFLLGMKSSLDSRAAVQQSCHHFLHFSGLSGFGGAMHAARLLPIMLPGCFPSCCCIVMP